MNAPRRVSPVLRLATGMTFLLAVSLSAPSFAAPTVRMDVPCKGCLFFPPPADATHAPLLVVLHGDAPGGKKPLVQRDSEPFVAAAVERGIAVLAPMCPKEEGCLVGSFWQWNQNDPPRWIAKQIDLIRKDTSIDANRIWIAGWSGGASFLGYHYRRLGEQYAAVILAGGGMPPSSDACAPCSPPAYFLVGDRNPLHHLAKDLKTSVLSCTKDVTWDLLPGKDHAGEWRALKGLGLGAKGAVGDPKPQMSNQGKVGELLDWLAKHPRNCPSVAEKPAADPPSPTVAPKNPSSAEATSALAPAPSASPSVSKPSTVRRGGCTIVTPASEPCDAWWFVGALVGGLSFSRRLLKSRVRCVSGSVSRKMDCEAGSCSMSGAGGRS